MTATIRDCAVRPSVTIYSSAVSNRDTCEIDEGQSIHFLLLRVRVGGSRRTCGIRNNIHTVSSRAEESQIGDVVFGSRKYQDKGRHLGGLINQKIVGFGDKSREWFAETNRFEKEKLFPDVSARDVDRMRTLAAGWTLDHVAAMCIVFQYLNGNRLRAFSGAFAQSLFAFGERDFWKSYEDSGSERMQFFDADGFRAMSVGVPFGVRVMTSIGFDPLLASMFSRKYGVFCARLLLGIWGVTAYEFSDNNLILVLALQDDSLVTEEKENRPRPGD